VITEVVSRNEGLNGKVDECVDSLLRTALQLMLIPKRHPSLSLRLRRNLKMTRRVVPILKRFHMDEYSFDLCVFAWLQSMDLQCTLAITTFELHLGQ